MLRNSISFIIILISSFSMQVFTQENNNIKTSDIPPAYREMRAAWVATVANIDWPSKPGLSTSEQQSEIISILDRLKELNMNAVVLQVRAQADAFYKSELEPWSYYLTGRQGEAPEPFYDPLQFWIDESHKRGIEIHAWFNPYRANHPAMKGEMAANSIVRSQPQWVRKLGNEGYYWMDPSMREVQEHSLAVVMDVVKRYDIDGVQFDDYFYPYTEYNEGKDFPDDETFNAYRSTGGSLPRDEWRRDAVNKFVKKVYDGIKSEKPHVKFGISPFGVYRPGHPPGIMEGGFDQYATLYADARLWLNEAWCDYYSPQLYFPISRIELSYPILLGWWNSENTKNINMWPGLFIRPNIAKKEMVLEIVNQVMVTRGMNPGSPGVILFSMKSLMPQDSSVGDVLKKGPFKNHALVPSSPWLDDKAPAPPDVTYLKGEKGIDLTWRSSGAEEAFQYVLYTLNSGKWTYEILPSGTNSKSIDDFEITAAAVSTVDRLGNESEKFIVVIEK